MGDLNDQLRMCLRDRHVALRGSGQSRIRSDEPVAAVDQNAPAVEVEELHGVLCVTIRRFFGGADDDKRLWEWAGDSLSHFSHERIVVDLRGNEGGNDAIMLEWLLPVLQAGARIPGTSTGWFVGAAPLGLWNSAALGMIEYGNIVPYVLPASGLHIGLTTKHNDYGVPIELAGLPVQTELDPRTPLSAVARGFDRLYRAPGR